MSPREETPAEATSDREFVTTRVFDAPRERVFDAIRDPARLARWWGPKGFTNTFQDFDLRTGGAWRFVMHGPDGTDYKNESVFVDVAAPERVVFDHVVGHLFRMTMTLDDLGEKTRLTWRMRFKSAAEHDKVKGFVPAANEENFDRLAAELARVS